MSDCQAKETRFLGAAVSFFELAVPTHWPSKEARGVATGRSTSLRCCAFSFLCCRCLALRRAFVSF